MTYNTFINFRSNHITYITSGNIYSTSNLSQKFRLLLDQGKISSANYVKVNSMKNKGHRQQSILARLILDQILGQLNIKDYLFTQDILGSPVLKSCPLFTSISHSRSVVVVALSDNPVGLDLEYIKNYEEVIKLFRKSEQFYINTAEDLAGISNRFAQIWTSKEGYLKYIGIGLQRKLDSFLIKPISKNHFLIIDPLKKRGQFVKSRTFKLNNYCLALVGTNVSNVKFQNYS